MTKYIFYGFASEYVLHDLFLTMQKKGFDVIEIDALMIKNSKKIINSLKGQKTTLITSAHLLLDKENFTKFYPNNNSFYSVLEIISLLKPTKKFFIPHDLTTPLIEHEEKFLNQFDIFFSPCEPYTSMYSRYCRVEEVGWIKSRHSGKPYKPKNNAIWFLSDSKYHIDIGPSSSYSMTKPVLDQGVSIKFPFWKDIEDLENFYRQEGAHVIDSTINTYDLINAHKLIITNGISSIIAESYLMGKPVANIMEGSFYGYLSKLELTTRFPEIAFHRNFKDFSLVSHDLTKKTKNLLASFNTKKVIELIR